jgi:hypothetical protein
MTTTSENVRWLGQAGKWLMCVKTARPSLICINHEAAFHELLAAEPMPKLRSMKRQDHEPDSSEPEKPRKPSRTEEAQRIVEEYADGLREILKKLRKLFH